MAYSLATGGASVPPDAGFASRDQEASMTKSSPDPAAWLTGVRASDEALGQALEAYRRYLLQIAQQQLDEGLRAKGGASDLVQETFLEAQRDFPQFRGSSEEEFRAWLRGLLLHRAANFRRQYRGLKRDAHREVGLQAGASSDDRAAALAANGLSPSGQTMALEEAQMLRRALEQLPEDYQKVLTLRYFEDRTFEEIGPLMQRTANAARLLWLRAIERLQDHLGPSHES